MIIYCEKARSGAISLKEPKKLPQFVIFLATIP